MSSWITNILVSFVRESISPSSWTLGAAQCRSWTWLPLWNSGYSMILCEVGFHCHCCPSQLVSSPRASGANLALKSLALKSHLNLGAQSWGLQWKPTMAQLIKICPCGKPNYFIKSLKIILIRTEWDLRLRISEFTNNALTMWLLLTNKCIGLTPLTNQFPARYWAKTPWTQKIKNTKSSWVIFAPSGISTICRRTF